MHRRMRIKSSRGAVVVEAALVTPVLMLMVFGIVELAFLLKDDVAVTSLVRQGGRTASSALAAHQGQSSATSPWCVTPTCSSGRAPELADLTALAMQRAGSALPGGSIRELWIYKAASDGYPIGNSGKFVNCSTDCVIYQWDAQDNRFAYYSGTWTASDINACSGDTLDSVGVYLRATHTFVTGLFSHSVDISDHAVFTFEPLIPTVCAARITG